MGELIIVTGPPGAGKSTVSVMVADSFDSSVLIPADWFFSRWRRGAIDPWLPQALTQTIVAADLPTRVLILTTYDLDEYVYQALRAGAAGFMLKRAHPIVSPTPST